MDFFFVIFLALSLSQRNHSNTAWRVSGCGGAGIGRLWCVGGGWGDGGQGESNTWVNICPFQFRILIRVNDRWVGGLVVFSRVKSGGSH